MKHKTSFRVRQLKAMHKLMCLTALDDIYLEWIALGVPDEPVEEDFINIAEEDDDYWRVVELFQLLINERGFYH